MARPLRIEYPGAVYHVTSRGDAGRKGDRKRREKEGHIFKCQLSDGKVSGLV